MGSDNAFPFILLGCAGALLLFILAVGHVDAVHALECQRLNVARPAIEVFALCGKV